MVVTHAMIESHIRRTINTINQDATLAQVNHVLSVRLAITAIHVNLNVGLVALEDQWDLVAHVVNRGNLGTKDLGGNPEEPEPPDPVVTLEELGQLDPRVILVRLDPLVEWEELVLLDLEVREDMI